MNREEKGKREKKRTHVAIQKQNRRRAERMEKREEVKGSMATHIQSKPRREQGNRARTSKRPMRQDIVYKSAKPKKVGKGKEEKRKRNHCASTLPYNAKDRGMHPRGVLRTRVCVVCAVCMYVCVG